MVLRIIFSTILFFGFAWSNGSLPEWYHKIEDSEIKKSVFIKIVTNKIEQTNKQIILDRYFVKNFFSEMEKKGFKNIDSQKRAKLLKIAKTYKIDSKYNKQEYLLKIDQIPVSLAVSQAVLESGWGKSKHAKEANNLFGHYKLTTKSAVKKIANKSGKVGKSGKNGQINKIKVTKKRIKTFNSIQEAVDTYALNLNTNEAYKDFRIQRAQNRSVGKTFTGIEASKTLKKYSELKNKYTAMIDGVIKQNNLTKLDQKNTQEQDHFTMLLSENS